MAQTHNEDGSVFELVSAGPQGSYMTAKWPTCKCPASIHTSTEVVLFMYKISTLRWFMLSLVHV